MLSACPGPAQPAPLLPGGGQGTPGPPRSSHPRQHPLGLLESSPSPIPSPDVGWVRATEVGSDLGLLQVQGRLLPLSGAGMEAM